MEQRRPLDPAVYRRRRLMVTVIGVLLVVFVAWLIVRLTGGGDPVTIPDPAAESPSSSPSGSAGTQPDIQADGSCNPADVSVLPTVTGGGADTGVQVDFQVRSLKAAACTWNFSADTIQVVISKGGADIWDTIDCPGEFPQTPLVLTADQPQQVAFTWDARYSSDGCPAETRWADPGDYLLEVAALGGEPSTTTFTLAGDASAGAGA